MRGDQAQWMEEARCRALELAARLAALREDLLRSRQADGAAAAQEAEAAARRCAELLPATPGIHDP